MMGISVLGPGGWEIQPNQVSRLRVDQEQIGFWAGHEFRTFKELSIAAAATYVVKAVVPINIILTGLELLLDAGSIRLGTYVGGTPGGSFSETLPIFARNNMTERPTVQGGGYYLPQVVLTAGGTHTGGTELDVLRLMTAQVAVQASSVGAAQGDERGVGANTYYFRLNNFSAVTATGTFKARWEERP